MYTVLFDIDGTIMDSGGAGREAMHNAMSVVFGVKVRTVAETFAGRTDRAIITDLMKLNGVDPTDENLGRIHDEYVKSLPSMLKKVETILLPGVRALIESLEAAEGVLLGLLTGNVKEGARIKLGHYDLYHFFPFGGFGDDAMVRDDVAAMALAEAKTYTGVELDANKVWVVGDTPLDISCARAIGAKVAAVCTGIHSCDELGQQQPDLLLHDLSDATPLLTALQMV